MNEQTKRVDMMISQKRARSERQGVSAFFLRTIHRISRFFGRKKTARIDPEINISVSSDGGKTWGPALSVPLSSQAVRTERVVKFPIAYV